MDENDVPIFSLNTKSKLKSFSFATSVSSLLFQNFSKEPSQSTIISKLDVESHKPEQVLKSTTNNERISVKRARDTNDSIQINDEIASTTQMSKKSKTTTHTNSTPITSELLTEKNETNKSIK